MQVAVAVAGGREVNFEKQEDVSVEYRDCAAAAAAAAAVRAIVENTVGLQPRQLQTGADSS